MTVGALTVTQMPAAIDAATRKPHPDGPDQVLHADCAVGVQRFTVGERSMVIPNRYRLWTMWVMLLQGCEIPGDTAVGGDSNDGNLQLRLYVFWLVWCRDLTFTISPSCCRCSGEVCIPRKG